MRAEWIVERTAHRRFPFRITIQQGTRTLLAVRAQAAWPGPGQQIFCLPERLVDPEEPLDPVERVPVTSVVRVGRKLTVALDRPVRKRCEFLEVRKAAADGREIRQLFFRTETAIRAHRSRTRLELPPGPVDLTVVVDTTERYPWRFPAARVLRRKLPVGDYALLDGERIIAVVERKSFENLLTDIGAIQALHHHLAQLAARPHAAMVIEAQYADFLNERRLGGRWPPVHTARVLAELAALHPSLPVVFAGNRKLANLWCERFFTACARQDSSPQLELVREAAAGYDPVAGLGVDERIRQAALARADRFTTGEMAKDLGEVDPVRVRRVLAQLAREGTLQSAGRGRGAYWLRLPATAARSGSPDR